MTAFTAIGESDCGSIHIEEAIQCRDQMLQSVSRKAAARTASGLPKDDVTLDAFARDFLAEVAGRRAEASDSGNRELEARLDDVRARLGALDCSTCAGSLAAPCGVDRHHHIVHDGGRCISEIKEVFGFACGIGGALYDNAWAGSASLPSTAVSIQLNTNTMALDTIVGDRARIRAQTGFDDRSSRGSIVNIDLDGDVYGDAERSVCPT